MRSFSCQKCPKKELRFGQIQSACLKVSYGNGNPSAVRFSEANLICFVSESTGAFLIFGSKEMFFVKRLTSYNLPFLLRRNKVWTKIWKGSVSKNQACLALRTFFRLLSVPPRAPNSSKCSNNFGFFCVFLNLPN